MTIKEAKEYVNARIPQIEAENPVGVLQPWERDAACLVQQQIALSHPNPHLKACCADLHLPTPKRSAAQEAASKERGRQFAAEATLKRQTRGVLQGQEQLNELVPTIRRIRDYFATNRGRAELRGCTAWREYCTRRLRVTPPQPRKHAAAGKRSSGGVTPVITPAASVRHTAAPRPTSR